MFHIFRKKEKPIPEVLHHEDMGDITFVEDFEWWEGKYNCTLFGKEKIIRMLLDGDIDDRYDIENQEKTFRYYAKNKEKINKEIEQELRRKYELADDFVLSDRFEPITFIMLLNGYSGIEFIDHAECEEIVVAITPKTEWYGPTEEFY